MNAVSTNVVLRFLPPVFPLFIFILSCLRHVLSPCYAPYEHTRSIKGYVTYQLAWYVRLKVQNMPYYMRLLEQSMPGRHLRKYGWANEQTGGKICSSTFVLTAFISFWPVSCFPVVLLIQMHALLQGSRTSHLHVCTSTEIQNFSSTRMHLYKDLELLNYHRHRQYSRCHLHIGSSLRQNFTQTLQQYLISFLWAEPTKFVELCIHREQGLQDSDTLTLKYLIQLFSDCSFRPFSPCCTFLS